MERSSIQYNAMIKHFTSPPEGMPNTYAEQPDTKTTFGKELPPKGYAEQLCRTLCRRRCPEVCRTGSILASSFFVFCFLGSPEANHPRAASMRTMPEGRTAPQIHVRGQPLQQQVPQGAPGSHTQDTASGTTPTWPPALNSMVCTLYNMLDKDFYSCTLTQEHPFE